jgi:hypothetical protein
MTEKKTEQDVNLAEILNAKLNPNPLLTDRQMGQILGMPPRPKSAESIASNWIHALRHHGPFLR